MEREFTVMSNLGMGIEESSRNEERTIVLCTLVNKENLSIEDAAEEMSLPVERFVEIYNKWKNQK